MKSQALVLFAFLILSVNSIADDGKLYALIVTDTHASKIGDDTKENAKNLTAMFEKAYGTGERLRAKVRLSFLQGRDATPAKIFGWLKDLRHEKKKDRVFIHISTHGSAVDKKYHKLDMSYGTIYRSDLLAALKAQDAKSAILLTDACGSEDRLPPRVHIVYKMKDTIPTPILDSLFFDTTGLIDINTAALGSYAWYGSYGGVFTYLFTVLSGDAVKDVDGNRDGKVSWSEYVAHLNSVDARLMDEEHRQVATIFNNGTWPKKQEYSFIRFRNLSKNDLKVTVFREIRDGGEWVFPIENLSYLLEAKKEINLTKGRDKISARRIRVSAVDNNPDPRDRVVCRWNDHDSFLRAYDAANSEWDGYLANEPETRLYEFSEKCSLHR